MFSKGNKMKQPSEVNIDELLGRLINHAQEYVRVFDFSTNEGIIDYILKEAMPHSAEEYRLQEEFVSLASPVGKDHHIPPHFARRDEKPDREESPQNMLSGPGNKMLFYAQVLLSLLHPERIEKPLDQFELPDGDYLPTIYVEKLRTLAAEPGG